MKRFAAILLAAILLLMTLASCAANDTGTRTSRRTSRWPRMRRPPRLPSLLAMPALTRARQPAITVTLPSPSSWTPAGKLSILTLARTMMKQKASVPSPLSSSRAQSSTPRLLILIWYPVRPLPVKPSHPPWPPRSGAPVLTPPRTALQPLRLKKQKRLNSIPTQCRKRRQSRTPLL